MNKYRKEASSGTRVQGTAKSVIGPASMPQGSRDLGGRFAKRPKEVKNPNPFGPKGAKEKDYESLSKPLRGERKGLDIDKMHEEADRKSE